MVMESTSLAPISGTKAGRAIVGQRNAIDHKLRLVFGAARMQHRIAFVEPARLRIDQVLNRAAGQRRQPVFECLRTDLIHRAGLVRVKQRSLTLSPSRILVRTRPSRQWCTAKEVAE